MARRDEVEARFGFVVCPGDCRLDVYVREADDVVERGKNNAPVVFVGWQCRCEWRCNWKWPVWRKPERYGWMVAVLKITGAWVMAQARRYPFLKQLSKLGAIGHRQ